MEHRRLVSLSTAQTVRARRHSVKVPMTSSFSPAIFAGEFFFWLEMWNWLIAWNWDFIYFFYDPISSVHLRWEQETNYRGINGYRYSVTQDFLNQLDDCFCINKIKDALTDEKGCLYPGALDLSDCVGELRWWWIENVWNNKLIEYSI